MKSVSLQISNEPVDFDLAKQMAELLALKTNEFSMLISWNDKEKNIHSPQCLHCEIKGEPGWEVYGRNHEGRLRISVNNDTFVFIYS